MKASLLLVLLSVAVLATHPAAAQNRPSHPEIVAKMAQMPRDREEPVKWETECDRQACTLFTDVLRGASNNPPDRTDHDDYISISVALDRGTANPVSFTLHMPPWAQKDQGVYLAFAQPAKDGEPLKYEVDTDGATLLAFAGCDDESCMTSVAGGLLEAGTESHKINLLDKFLASDHLLVLFESDGAPYYTAISLSSFKKEYDRVIKGELAHAASR